jgi:hypothetical protein
VRANTGGASQCEVRDVDQIELTASPDDEGDTMSHSAVSAVPLQPGAGRFRLTDKGRAWMDLVQTDEQLLGSLSRYLNDVLLMCGSDMRFEQLLQFMPPRSLSESLVALQSLGLLERIEAAHEARLTRASRSYH